MGLITAVHEELAEEPPAWADTVVAFFEILNEKNLAALQRAGKTVFVWTINEEANMRKFVDMGVDGIASDDPILLKKVLTGHY